jgi:hypothetical protein
MPKSLDHLPGLDGRTACGIIASNVTKRGGRVVKRVAICSCDKCLTAIRNRPQMTNQLIAKGLIET